MSAIAAHYAAPGPAVPDRRYAELAAHYDPAAFFQYSSASLTSATTAHLDGAYALGSANSASAASYAWDAHGHADESPPPPYSPSSSSAHAYHASAPPPPVSGHASVTASFSYSTQLDYPVSAHRAYPSRATASHHANPSPSLLSSATGSHSAPALPGRSSYSSGTRSYSSLAAAAAVNTTSSSTTPRLQNANWESAAAGLYTIDPSDPVSHSSSRHSYGHSSTGSSPQLPPSSPPIKEEDAEGEFIIEVSVPADPVPSSMPEVPLRATHAPPKMRAMMYSFRLESFAMHDGIRSAATQPGPGGIEVGPLKDAPVELEWQAILAAPLIPDEALDPYQYSAVAAPNSSKTRSQDVGYGAQAVASPRRSGAQDGTGSRRRRGDYVPNSPSPTLSMDPPQSHLDNDAWDGSSAYGSVADNGSGSNATTAAASPTFAPIMTPAQSLGWSARYQTNESDLESSIYHRQPVAQASLSRVSQTQGRYVLGGGSAQKTSYHPSHQQTQYGEYDTSGYSRSSGATGRYAEVYASSASNSAWYRTS
ncbi:hypothetical protein BD413DRAFT_615673 [Trametes elegans]|nr:hypothetical protein BD413DRAFT_615673 [Trametes elegans]